jgi:surface polysaccharide O-acyltransferase-like enzyme
MLTKRYISGFDYLRAFFSILVVVWHDRGLSFLAKTEPVLTDIVNCFYYNLCLLAVPVFFQISLFLFYKKQLNEKKYFIKNRLPNLLLLYGIWTFISVVINSLIRHGTYLREIANPKIFLSVVIMGSNSELFFLFSLIFVTFLAFLNTILFFNGKTSLFIQSILLLLSLVAIVFQDTTTLLTHKSIFSEYWNPICFIPYVFSSSILVLLHQEGSKSIFHSWLGKNKLFFISLLFMFFILSSCLEWQLLSLPKFFNGYLLPPYARVSLVFGALMTTYCAILVSKKSGNLIQQVSQESLGIYLIHSYLLLLFLNLEKLQTPVNIVLNPIFKVILAVTIPIFLSKVLKKYQIGRLILNSSSK